MVLSYILPFLVIITVLVFVHELGHYLVARYNNVRVEVFSIGFGPELVGWTDAAQTRWKICLIPLGGYVRMFGDADAASRPDTQLMATLEESERQFSLPHKSVPARIAVSAAGPAANYLFSFLLFVGLFMLVGKTVNLPTLSTVMPQSPAAMAGLKPGDTITQVNGAPIARFEEIGAQLTQWVAQKGVTQKIHQANPQSVVVTILRDATPQAITMAITVHPKLKTTTDLFGKTTTRATLGIQGTPGNDGILGLQDALIAAAEEVWSFSINTLTSLGQMITGNRSSGELGGILRIAQMSGDTAAVGFVPLLNLLAILSLSLGLINLVPIPMLDGGHILLYTLEAIRGKPLPEKAVDILFKIGFAIVAALMLLAIANDIQQLKVIDFVLGFFR